MRRLKLYKIFTLCSFICIFSFGVAYSQGLVIMAKKVSEELPLDPKDKIWTKADVITVPLAPQVMAKPRIYESRIKELKVRALHNTKDIAILIEWEDPTEDAALDIERFSDAVALEFPSQIAKAKPHFAMGDKENIVNIWFWKAAWQKKEEETRLYAMVDDFVPGIEAGNPVSRQRINPVENIIA